MLLTTAKVVCNSRQAPSLWPIAPLLFHLNFPLALPHLIDWPTGLVDMPCLTDTSPTYLDSGLSCPAPLALARRSSPPSGLSATPMLAGGSVRQFTPRFWPQSERKTRPAGPLCPGLWLSQK